MELSLFTQDETVKIVLSDNGVGIEKEDLQHIFERLYKCDKGRSGKGSGLGLSIAYQIMEKMGGRIAADSVAGQGTVFSLCLPIFTESKADESSPALHLLSN